MRVQNLVRAAQQATGISADEILGPCRMNHIVRVRFAIAWAAVERGVSKAHLARQMRRDRSTIRHSLSMAEVYRARDIKFAQLCDQLKELPR